MAEEPRPPIADDYSYIARRMRELSLDQQSQTKWGWWWEPPDQTHCWLHCSNTGELKKANREPQMYKPTLFENETDAINSLSGATMSSKTRAQISVRRYTDSE